ncbi:MAG: class I SAM-dependent methyltransferase [Thermomicrobiales bacterium]
MEGDLPSDGTRSAIGPAIESGENGAGSNPEIVNRLRQEIAQNGPITVARFMERALYEPGIGYYQTPERRPGRGGDFITSPEIHAFFGFTLARQIADCWRRLERPNPFVVREYGPGIGGLAYDILAALSVYDLEVRNAIQYHLVDVNPHRMHDALEAMVEVGLAEIVSVETPQQAAENPVTGVVLANEVADAFPVHQVIVQSGILRERFVTLDEETGWFGWVTGDLSEPVAELDLPTYLPGEGVILADLPDGSLLEVSPATAGWVRDVASGLERGYALIIDYGYPAAELYRSHRLGGLLRGYFAHTVTDDPFVEIGEQDLTAHVDFSALIREAQASGMHVAGLTMQGDFLAALGMGDFLVEMQQQPDVSLTAYYETQAAVMRLFDPGGLGRFRVLALAKDAATDPPLRGFAPPELPASLRL